MTPGTLAVIFFVALVAMTVYSLWVPRQQLTAEERDRWAKARSRGFAAFLISRSWPAGLGFLIGDILSHGVGKQTSSWLEAILWGVWGCVCAAWWSSLRWRRTEKAYQLEPQSVSSPVA